MEKYDFLILRKGGYCEIHKHGCRNVELKVRKGVCEEPSIFEGDSAEEIVKKYFEEGGYEYPEENIKATKIHSCCHENQEQSRKDVDQKPSAHYLKGCPVGIPD